MKRYFTKIVLPLAVVAGVLFVVTTFASAKVKSQCCTKTATGKCDADNDKPNSQLTILSVTQHLLDLSK